ncbi:MAG: choice-of-anchor J domain-containing protein [Candidatus Cloacimonetes bacterium]|nr:choice-of-anchor J domain-containing protein [Candidatus Cloacimonadota bacterium]
MKTIKKLFKENIGVLFFILSIPLFLAADDSATRIYSTDLEGRCIFDSFLNEMPEYSRTVPEQMPGWPQDMYVPSYYSPSGVNLVDINNNGFLEIISACTDGSVHIWDYLGNELTGWPKFGLEQIQSKPAIGDLDTDYPGLEIIAVGKPNTLYAWHNDGTAVAGFPLTIGETGGFRASVLFDIDNDGFLEIILSQKTYPTGQVIVFNHDGTTVPGWPQPMDYLGVATPAVGDLDNDGEIEICAVSFYSVYLWDKDGNAKPGWPHLNVAGGMSYAQPVFADLDDDGDFEILHSYYTSNTNYVGIYHHDGTTFENWPQIYPGPQNYVMAIPGDIDNDDDLEIFGGCHGYGISERHHTGEEVAGWPVDIYNLESSPIIFDLDNDGVREIVFGGTAGSFHAYNGDGSLVEDWPISAGGNSMVNSAAVGDVDGDGDIEIALVVHNGTVNLWTIEDVPYRPYLTDWGTYYHDAWNTGWMHPLPPQNLTAEISEDDIVLNWNANTEPDIAGYNIYKKDNSTGFYTKINSELITDVSYIDVGGLETDIYCVTAEIKAYTESRLSNEAFCQNPTAWIEGTVTIDNGEGDVQDVLITVGAYNTSPNADGFYSMEVACGSYTIEASLEGYIPVSYDIVIDAGETEVVNFILELLPVGWIEGTITLDGGEGDVQDVVVTAGEHTTNPNIAGFYSMEVVLGSYTVEASLEEYTPVSEDIVVDGGETEVVDFILVVLPDQLFPPSNLTIDITAETEALLSWDPPVVDGDEIEEGFDADTFPDGWNSFDNDGDGYYWEVSVAWGGNNGSAHCMTSASYINNIGALFPDNWLISPALTIGGASELRFYVAAQDPSWTAEQYYVKVSTTGDQISDFTTTIHSAVPSSGSYTEVVLSLSDFAGQTIYLAWQHADVTDMFWLNLDDISVINSETREITFSADFETAKSIRQFKTGNSYKNENYRDRVLTGYNVYLDGTQVEENTVETEFLFTGLVNENTYIAGVSAVYTSGTSEIVEYEFEFEYVDTDEPLINEFVTKLNSNYPNPFNPETNILFSTKESGFVVVEVYNLKGQKVKTLINEVLNAGSHQVIWNGNDESNNPVSSGIYLYKIKFGKYNQTKKMILLK